MKKHISEDAYYERLRQLGETKKPLKNENISRSLGTLIDYKSAPDGIHYGIIKENHNYYIKKAGTKANPDVSDFTYIGGLGNVTDFQYKSLGEADKQRNMIFQTISESISLKLGKKRLNEAKSDVDETKVEDEIEASAEMVDDLDAATDAAESEPETEDELGVEEPVSEPDGELDTEEPVSEPEGELGAEESTEEIEDEEGSDETGAITDTDLETKEIEKNIGKITNKIRNIELTPIQIKSYINSFLSSFKDKLPELEIEERKKMADKILKVVPAEDIENIDTEEETGIEENEECSECGSFGKYAESRGYTKESITECDNDEITNLVSGYANAHNDGMNDGNFELVALFVNPEIIDSLKSDYGHNEYAEKLTPHVDSMNETTEEDKQVKINELWGGLSQLGKKAGEVVGGAAKKLGQNITQKVGDVKQAVGQKVGDVKQVVGQKVGQAKQAVGKAVQGVKQSYYAGEKNAAIKKAEELALNLGKQLATINANAVKAGQEPINVNSVLTTIKNQLGSKGSADLSKLRTAENIELTSGSDNLGIVAEGKKINEISPELISKAKKIAVNKFYNEKDPQKKEKFGRQASILRDKDYKNTDDEEIDENKEKPSAGLTAKQKSNVVKKAKAGEDIGEKGKDFEKVAQKAAKQYGSKEKGEKVAAAAMWKNVKREGKEVVGESEQKLKKYIHNRLEEKTGKRKPSLNEDKKSETLKKLDKIIDEQFQLYESVKKKA